MNIIIIPYRNRESHLKYFLNNTFPLLKKHLKELKVVIIEQTNDKLFNRGKLLNIGYKLYSSRGKYYFTHDVDINPTEETIKKYYTKEIENEIMGIYTSQHNTLGGIIKYTSENFDKINGFPNTIWGWGSEDKALQNRVEYKKIKIKKNILNNDPNKDKYFKIFNDINDRVTINLSDTIQKYYNNYLHLSNMEKERMMSSDGLSSLRYKILKKDRLMDDVDKIVVEI